MRDVEEKKKKIQNNGMKDMTGKNPITRRRMIDEFDEFLHYQSLENNNRDDISTLYNCTT
jgi:hypothetical protein